MKMKPKAIDGVTIRHLREDRKISQGELAKAIGFSYSQISRLENNKVKAPSLEMAENLAEFFGVTISYLKGGEK